jgi:hypothetical protein
MPGKKGPDLTHLEQTGDAMDKILRALAPHYYCKIDVNIGQGVEKVIVGSTERELLYGHQNPEPSEVRGELLICVNNAVSPQYNEMGINEMARKTGLSAPTVSKHVTKLRLWGMLMPAHNEKFVARRITSTARFPLTPH